MGSYRLHNPTFTLFLPCATTPTVFSDILFIMEEEPCCSTPSFFQFSPCHQLFVIISVIPCGLQNYSDQKTLKQPQSHQIFSCVNLGICMYVFSFYLVICCVMNLKKNNFILMKRTESNLFFLVMPLTIL